MENNICLLSVPVKGPLDGLCCNRAWMPVKLWQEISVICIIIMQITDFSCHNFTGTQANY